MGKRFVKVNVFMTTMMLALTGCGATLPDMTPEEEEIVAEYAANLLLKYDANNRSRLVSREEVEAEEEVPHIEETEVHEPTQEETEPVEDNPVIEIEQETSSDDIVIDGLEEFFTVPDGVKIIYQSKEVCKSYPQDGVISEYLAVDAVEGKELLLLKFTIENQSQEEQTVDLLSQTANMQVKVNGGDSYPVLTTMLMDDMATYIGDIPAGQKVDTVLVAEVDSDVIENISSLSLNLKNDSKTYTIQLQ